MSRLGDLDDMYIRAVKVHVFAGGRFLRTATGFYILRSNLLYLMITQRVVNSSVAGCLPDCLYVSLHSRLTELQPRDGLSVPIPLYVNGVPQWKRHLGDVDLDLIAVAVNESHVLSSHVVVPFLIAPLVDEATALIQGGLAPGRYKSSRLEKPI